MEKKQQIQKSEMTDLMNFKNTNLYQCCICEIKEYDD